MAAPLPVNEKNLVISFIHYLRQKVAAGEVTAEQQEGLEVAIQCMESAFSFAEPDYAFHPSRPLPDIFAASEGVPEVKPEAVSAEDKAAGEGLKNEGNELMREGKFEEAVRKYSEAIDTHASAIFFCNRAAAYSKLEKHDEAITDCRKALGLDPAYSKAYGRMGMALSCQSRYREASDAYKKALELEPANQSFKNNLAVVEDKLREAAGLGGAGAGLGGAGANPFGAMGGLDIGSMLNNPAMMNMASQLMSDPNMQNMMAGLVGGSMGQEGGAQGLEGLMRAGQQLAQQMATQNPDLVNQLRSNFQGDGPNPDGSNPPGNPPPGGNPPDQSGPPGQ